MDITLVNINGFTFNALEKLMDCFRIDEIIDARMNLGAVALRHFYNNRFPKVRYIIKLANTKEGQCFELEYKKGEYETPFGKELNKLCASTNEVIGLDRLTDYVWRYNIQLREEIGVPLSADSKSIFSNNIIKNYLLNTSNDLPHIISLYKRRFSGGNKISTLYELEEQLEYIRDCIVRVEEGDAKHELGAEGTEEFELAMNYCYIQEPRPHHFLDVENICIIYSGNKTIREQLLKIFSPEQYEYENLSEWEKNEYDNTNHTNYEYDDDDDFDDYRDCYKLKHWIKFEEINRDDFFDIEECDLCQTEDDFEKVKNEREKWRKWKKQQSLRNREEEDIDEIFEVSTYEEEEDNQRDAYYAMNDGTDNVYENDKYDPYWEDVDFS